MSDQILSMASPSLFPTDGELRVAGLREPVSIDRDDYGVPTIRAASLEDLWFAHGLVTAGERLFQLDLTLRAATGRLSEIFGERTFEDDRFARTVGFAHAAARQVDGWTEEDRAMHARFRAGARAWLSVMPAPPIEYTLLDLQPEVPDDPLPYAAAFVLLAWNLSSNWDSELLRAEIDREAGPETTDVLMPAVSGGGGQGSNDWAVSGAKTASGRPLLANDPHLVVAQPGPWLEIHLRAPGYDARGVALPFTPGVILGATPHHAWGVTNVTGDVQDLYEERLDPDGTAALYEGAWEPLTIRAERIAVRGEREPRVVEVRQSRHGPILTHRVCGILHRRYRELDRPYALRWTGHETSIRPSLPLAAARANGFAAFREAALQVGCPGQNFVYADVDGTIGYQCTGVHPIRRAGDGTRPVPGWTAEHEWDGRIPLEELPHEVDPERGSLVTANNDIHPSGYPYLIARDFHQPYRLRRIEELLDARDDHDVASMQAIQSDTVSLPARTTLPLLLSLVPVTDELAEALAGLESWDGNMAADSRPAALYNTWCAAIAGRTLGPILGEELTADYLAWRERFQCAVLPALLRESDGRVSGEIVRAALDDAIERTGPATWGELHTLVAAHPLASIPGLGSVFTAASVPFGGDEQTVAQAGSDGLLGFQPGVIASWRVVWDLGDLERSTGVVPTGVSGNPASPHWNDQLELYTAGRAKPYRSATPPAATLTVAPS